MYRHVLALVVGIAVVCLTGTAAHAGDSDNGKSIYLQRCAFCHGVYGKGDGPGGAALKPLPSDLTSPELWQRMTLTQMREAIADGKPRTAMVAFKGSLTPAQIDDVLTFLTTFRTRP